ncbi:hypothetical protein Tco_0975054 [Tanacetum coccineum]|uniref:Uncharacterized protein n=1 Tax=Tanacetum coccineum TaxID=301880 RepID=A0ABQ5EEH1_9ASTR
MKMFSDPKRLMKLPLETLSMVTFRVMSSTPCCDFCKLPPDQVIRHVSTARKAPEHSQRLAQWTPPGDIMVANLTAKKILIPASLPTIYKDATSLSKTRTHATTRKNFATG